MKVTGVLVALAAAAPMASAIPFRMADFIAPMARAPAPAEAPKEVFPQVRSTNLTARAVPGTNETEPPFPFPPHFPPPQKRGFVPQDSEHSKRSFHNGIEGLDRRTNLTFKA